MESCIFPIWGSESTDHWHLAVFSSWFFFTGTTHKVYEYDFALVYYRIWSTSFIPFKEMSVKSHIERFQKCMSGGLVGIYLMRTWD